jgi:hypothetical protein
VRLTMADTPMGADPVQNQPTPPSGACSPLPSPPLQQILVRGTMPSCHQAATR